MAVDVTTSTTIARPRETVAAYVADPANAPQWYAKIASVEWRTPKPVGKGSQLDFVAHFLGRRLAYTYEVVEFDPPERMVMRTASGPFPMETTSSRADARHHAREVRASRCGGRAGAGRSRRGR